MKIVEVYHAGTEVVAHPDVKAGRPELDFGQGFYITDVYDQAARWALKRAAKLNGTPIVNKYILYKERLLASDLCNAKIFTAYNEEWLDFIVGNRLGKKLWTPFNYIEGGLADDRIVNTVDLYFNGDIDREEAIKRLKIIAPNNQICILDQNLLNSHLKFTGHTEIIL